MLLRLWHHVWILDECKGLQDPLADLGSSKSSESTSVRYQTPPPRTEIRYWLMSLGKLSASVSRKVSVSKVQYISLLKPKARGNLELRVSKRGAIRMIPRRYGEPCSQGVVADLLAVVAVPQANLALRGPFSNTVSTPR
jgi:hypothetical protein